MDKLCTSNLKLGIIAGGQLAKMLIQEASKWDVISYVLDDDDTCPAKEIASHFVKGSRFDFESVYKFGKMVDVLSFEIESINVEALQKLKSEGLKILPDPDVLELIQDKGLQKMFYENNNIPTAPFKLFENTDAILSAITERQISFPFVQKLRKGGYDGRGVAVINNSNETNKLLQGASLIEEKINILKEISVIVARNKQGGIKTFPIVEMLFDAKANIVDKILCPSSITHEQSEKAINYACKIIELLKMEGVLAIEFFVNSKGDVIINEAAPRTHNSGHHTIESTLTSQFEQHLRAILNLPLGATKLIFPSVLINILGAVGYEGPVFYEGLKESMAIEGVKIHLYGKKITRPYRKMGHVTVVSSTLEEALYKSEQVKQLIKVKSWTKK